MAMKGTVLCCSLLVLIGAIQCASLEKIEVKSNSIAPREILNVNGKRYLVLAGEITLEGAWNECEIYNARLVSFEEEREYLDILSAIRNIGYADQWFWTAGQRDKDSDIWYWSPSGKQIEQFYWIPGHPNVPKNVSSCLNFNIQAGGWAADPCVNNYVLGIVCEQ